MAKLTARGRRRLKRGAFALKGRRFPVNDKSHARNALARASQGVKRGTLSSGEAATVRRKVCGKYPSMPSCKRKGRRR